MIIKLFYSSVADKVFWKFLEVMSSKEGRAIRSDSEREIELEEHAQFLLVRFNHIHRQIRKVADKFLSGLVDKYVFMDFAKYFGIILNMIFLLRFPNLLWSGVVLRTMLDVLQVLSRSLTLDPNQDNSPLEIPNTPYSLQLMDNVDARKVGFSCKVRFG